MSSEKMLGNVLEDNNVKNMNTVQNVDFNLPDANKDTKVKECDQAAANDNGMPPTLVIDKDHANAAKPDHIVKTDEQACANNLGTIFGALKVTGLFAAGVDLTRIMSKVSEEYALAVAQRNIAHENLKAASALEEVAIAQHRLAIIEKDAAIAQKNEAIAQKSAAIKENKLILDQFRKEKRADKNIHKLADYVSFFRKRIIGQINATERQNFKDFEWEKMKNWLREHEKTGSIDRAVVDLGLDLKDWKTLSWLSGDIFKSKHDMITPDVAREFISDLEGTDYATYIDSLGRLIDWTENNPSN